MPTTMDVLIQSVISFIVLLILARLMGKRQVAQLSFFDYIVGITVGNIAASWSLDDVKKIHAVASLLVWTILSLIVALIQRKSYRARILLDGKEVVLIEDGQVLERNLKKVDLNIEELMLLLREKDIFKLSEVQHAVFETNGSLSAMKKTEFQPVTPKDANIPVMPDGAPKIVVIDGHVMEDALAQTGYSKSWLLGEIEKQGGKTFRDVFIGQIEANGSVYIDLYHDSIQPPQLKEKPLLAASLKKFQADMEAFALETEDPNAKATYTKNAQVLKQLVDEINPYLKQ